MNWKDNYIKIFLKQLGQPVNQENIKSALVEWFKNTRAKDQGGLRLTDEGYRMMSEDLDISFYEVPYAPETRWTIQLIIWLDNFIDCPYYLDKYSMFVTDDKKALELHMFSGDIKKYGMTKALARQEAQHK